MKKILLQGLTIMGLFFFTWFLLDQVNWMTIFEIEKNTERTEEKLGELFLDILTSQDIETENLFVIETIDSILSKICSKNNIDRDQLKVHILSSNDVNAFALPGDHLIINSELILDCENPEALSGVVAHEIAHIQQNHVMQKLVKEVGLSLLISMTTGNGNGQIIKEAAKVLSSSAFDRGLEKEADIQAVEYLVNAHLNPEPFANFLYKIGDKEQEVLQYFTWLQTHPDSKERAEYIIEYSTDLPNEFEPIISKNTWNQLKIELENK